MKEKKVAVYIRTGNRCRENVEKQVNTIFAYISEKQIKGKYEVYIDDGFSGNNKKRPEYKRLLKDLKKEDIDTIIVYDLSRLCRNILRFNNDFRDYIINNRLNIIGVIDSYNSVEDYTYLLFNNTLKLKNKKEV